MALIVLDGPRDTHLRAGGESLDGELGLAVQHGSHARVGLRVRAGVEPNDVHQAGERLAHEGDGVREPCIADGCRGVKRVRGGGDGDCDARAPGQGVGEGERPAEGVGGGVDGGDGERGVDREGEERRERGADLTVGKVEERGVPRKIVRELQEGFRRCGAPDDGIERPEERRGEARGWGERMRLRLVRRGQG